MPKDPASKKSRESRKGKEKRYHDDGYRDRDTPRVAYQSTGEGREGYDHPGEASQSPADQLEYPGQNQDAWTSVHTNFESLSVDSPASPDSRSNYTTDPPQYGASTSYQSTYPAATPSAVPSLAAGSTSPSTYTTSGYTSYYGGNQATDAATTYPATTTYASTYPNTQAPASPIYPAYPSSYQTAVPSTHYSQASYGSSYGPNSGHTAQPQAYPYATETAHPTTYGTSPSYTEPQGSKYQTSQDPSAAQIYNPTATYTPQSSDYAAREPERHTPAPVAIKQCGCLGCDVDGTPDSRPKLKDGKEEHKKNSSSSKKADSSRSKHSSSSKKSDTSKSKAVSTSAPFEIHAATVDKQNGNMNCGALYLHDIKPWAKPQPPHTGSSRDEERDYKARLERWREESKAWRDTSCPCRYGYFNTKGQWVAGSHVRKYLKEGPDAEGANPPNPRWENNGWMAPEQPEVEKKG